MRAALVTVTLVLLAGLLWVMGGRLSPSFGPAETCQCPHAAEARLTKKKPALELTNRVWRNKVPKDGRDLTFHMVLFDKAKLRAGAMAHLSEWRYYVDRVRFRVQGKTLTIESPQDRTKTTFDVRTYRCKGEAPKPFDLCLELKRGKRKVTLYSERNAHFTRTKAQSMLERAAFASEPLPTCTDCVDVAPEWFERLVQ